MVEYPLHYSVQVARSVDDALALLGQCRNLSAPTCISAPSLQMYWLRAFVRYYGLDRQIAFTSVSDGERYRLVAPLQMSAQNCLTFICDQVSDYNDLLYDVTEPNTLKAALAHWLSLGVDRFELSRLPEDSATIGMLQIVAKELALEISVEMCDYMPTIRTNFNLPIDLWPGVNISRIHKFQRYLRSLQEQSSVTFRLIESEEDLAGMLPRMIEMHIDRWNRQGFASKFLDLRRQQFTYEVCKEALQVSSLVTTLMFIDQSLVSYHLCFYRDDTIFDWNTSFAYAYRKWSPGNVLLLMTMMRASELQFNNYNLMRGEEPYKYYWTDQSEHTVTVTLDRATDNSKG